MGVLRRRRRRGARLRRLGLPLCVPRRRQESGKAVHQQIEGRRPAQVRGEGARRRPQAARQRHRRLSARRRRRRAHGSLRASGRRQSAAQGRPGLFLRGRQQGLELRRRSRLDDFLRRRVGGGTEVPDAGDRSLRRPRRTGLALGHLRGELALSSAAGRQARLFRPDSARPGLLRAFDAVHRLEQVGDAIAQDLERPPVLSRRRGAAVARRAGQDAASLYPRGGMAARVDLRHGDRRRRHRRLRLPGIFPDFDGRREAAEARP